MYLGIEVNLYKDAEFNVWAGGEDGKIASEYKQFDCLGTYDTLSKIRKESALFLPAERQ